MRFYLLLLVCFFGLAAIGAEDVDLGKVLLDRRGALWEAKGNDLEAASGGVLIYLDSSKNSLRGAPKSKTEKMLFYGLDAQEVIISLKDGKPERVSVSVYNRGDSKPITEKEFDQILKSVNEKLQPLVEGVTPTRQSARLNSKAKIQAKIWRHKEFELLLRWSNSEKAPEYIIVEFYRPGATPTSLRQGIRSNVDPTSLPDRVLTDDDGNKFLFIPMVDQGKKGYCVVASVERILRYYGSEIDQHALAQIAKSDAKYGTNIYTAMNALEEAKSKLKIRCEELVRNSQFTDEDELNRTLHQYDQIARKRKVPKIDYEEFTIYKNYRKVRVDYKKLLATLNPEVYIEVRQKDKGAKPFEKEIRAAIDRGIPLIWGTLSLPGMTGNDAKVLASHMRIISGYHPENGNIVFTDSWGPGHEKKVMNIREAWAITTILVKIEPR